MKTIKPILSIVALLLFCASVNAQAIFYHQAPPFDNSTSTARGPNGTSTHVYMRACGLVKATELTALGSTNTITVFGFTVNSAAATNAPTGSFTVYLQNTTDLTYSKGTSFTTAISAMTQVYASSLTIPVSATTTSVVVTLSTPFVYNGGGLYVAYDWYNPGPYSTSSVVYRCNSGGLSPGLASYGGTTLSDALGTTAFRPNFILGCPNTYTNEVVVTGVDAPGTLSGMLGTSHTVTTFIRNSSNTALNNIPVSLNIGGANTFASTQTISTLAAGASTTLTFVPTAPTVAGLNTITVSVPSDDNNTNNTGVYNQSITCNKWALNPAAVSYSQGSVGFNTGSGIIAVSYTNPSSSTLTGINAAVSTNTPSIGNGVWGVLMNSTGSVLATTNTVTITSGMLGVLNSFTFSTPPTLASGTNYYIGLAQPTGTAGYFPMGTYTSAYVPFTSYVTTGTVGGTPAPLTSNLGYFNIEAVFLPTLALTATSQTVNCGVSATLSATSAASYTWTGGPSNANHTVTPLVNTNYTVSAVNAFGCAGSAIASVSVNQLTVTATSNTSAVCGGNSVNISVTGAPSFTWNTGPNLNASSFTVIPLGTTVYIATGSNPAGCTSTGSVTVTVHDVPAVTVNAQTVTCGTTATLQANISSTGPTNYTWTGGPSDTDYQVTPTTSSLYPVNVSNQFGCAASFTAAVIVIPITVTASSNKYVICAGDSVVLTASGASSYTWSGVPPIYAASFTDYPNTTTSYSVEGSNAAGCLASSSEITVVVNTFSTLAATNYSMVTCAGGTVSTTATGGVSYVWNTGSGTYTTATITQTPTASTAYTVTGTDQNGCEASMWVTVIVNQLPAVNVLASHSVICLSSSVTFTANGAANYSWSNNAGGGAMVTITPSSTGTAVYTVTGTSAASCAATAQATVNVLDCTGINEFGKQQTSSVYPNPFAESIHVMIPYADVNTHIRVLNTSGQEIINRSQIESSSVIEMSNYAQGIYFLQVIQQGKVIETIKIVKD